MPSLDGASHPLLAALQEAFGPLVEDDLVDLSTDEEDDGQDAFEVQADDWTLFVEGWPLHNAWLAIDDDTGAPEQFRTALEGTFSERDLEALEALNQDLQGELARVLNDSADGLSMALAAMLAADVTE